MSLNDLIHSYMDGVIAGDSSKSATVKQMLKVVKTKHDVQLVLFSTLRAKLQSLNILYDAMDNMYDETPLAADMGVDSLVAFEMRSWFLKEYSVDVPVMRILSGSSIATLAEDVRHKLPKEMTKKLESSKKRK